MTIDVGSWLRGLGLGRYATAGLGSASVRGRTPPLRLKPHRHDASGAADRPDHRRRQHPPRPSATSPGLPRASPRSACRIPISVDDNGRLLAGARKLAACKPSSITSERRLQEAGALNARKPDYDNDERVPDRVRPRRACGRARGPAYARAGSGVGCASCAQDKEKWASPSDRKVPSGIQLP